MIPFNKIWVIGSGPSAKQADFKSIPVDDTVFGVNGTVEWVPRLDWWFTLDKNPKNLRRLKSPRMKGVQCFVALPKEVKLPQGVKRYQRLAAEHRIIISRRFQRQRRHHGPQWWMWRWSAVKPLSENPNVIHTGNSLWGALQIAYHFKFKKIILVGLDGDSSNRVEGGQPNSLLHLPILFESAVNQLNTAGITVLNSSLQSTVTCFPRVSFEEALAA